MVQTHPRKFDVRDQRSGVSVPEQLEGPAGVDVSESGAGGRLVASSGSVAARHGGLAVGANWQGAEGVSVEGKGAIGVTCSTVGRGQVCRPESNGQFEPLPCPKTANPVRKPRKAFSPDQEDQHAVFL